MKSIEVYTDKNISWIGFFVPTGSKVEDNITKGKAHFLEHMLFKGTINRDKNQLKKELEQYGATLNAFTDYELTCYWSLISSNYASKAEEVLQDMVYNSIIPENEFKKEKDVVLQEIKMYHDNPQAHIYNLANEILFHKSSGIHLPICGTLGTVKNIEHKDLLDFYTKFYTDNTVCKIAIGNTQSFLPQPQLQSNKEFQRVNLEANTYLEKRQGVSQANIMFCGTFKSTSSPIATYFTFQLLNGLLNGFTGRLFDTIREKNNLVYSVHFWYEHLNCNTVAWYVYAGLEPSKIDYAVKLIKEELTRTFSQEEINFAIKKHTGQLQITLDSPQNIGTRIAYSLIKDISYTEKLHNYTSNLLDAGETINQIQNQIDFNEGVLVGIVPKE